MTAPSKRILRIDASMRRDGSVTRGLADRLITRLTRHTPATRVVTRDLAEGVEVIDAAWIGANFTDPAARSPEQRTALAHSDRLIAELRDADTIVIGLPVYNFGVPAAFKAWIDQIARARETFRYTESGPVGLLTGKRAYVVVASGGVQVGSAVDFATPYVRHALAFVGITDVEFVAADRLAVDAAAAVAGAEDRIERLAA
jgi:FMN-dependent NADH-azoreductase